MSFQGYEAPTAGMPDAPPSFAAVRPAGWWRRVGAAVLDAFLIGIPVAIVAVAAGIYDRDGELTIQLMGTVAALAYATAMLAYRAGQTIGKQAVSIRVVDADGSPVGLGRAFGRELAKAVFAATGILYVVDVLWPLRHPTNRALHDLVGGTRVVMARGPR